MCVCVSSEGSRLAARHWREGRAKGVSKREKVPPLSGAMHSGQGRTQNFNVAGNAFVVARESGWVAFRGEGMINVHTWRYN